MVREFKLVNEKGQEYSLMDPENYCFLSDPTGLGYSNSIEYEKMQNTFIETLNTIEQGKVEGTAIFENYDNYLKLINFTEFSESLKFVYKIPFLDSEKEYYRDVKLQSLSKTQKQTDGLLKESIVFDCLSLWYSENTITYTVENSENEIRWDFIWGSIFKSSDARNLDFKNTGHVEATIELEIDGPVINPKFELYINGNLCKTIDLTVEIKKYEKLLYGTRENQFHIKKINVDGTEKDLFEEDVIDINNDNVIRFPKNKDCTFKIISDEEITFAEIKIYEFFKAV